MANGGTSLLSDRIRSDSAPATQQRPGAWQEEGWFLMRPDSSTRTITLNSGRCVLVDEADYWHIAHLTWCESNGYAATVIGGTNITMHRMLMLPDPGLEIDHVNGVKLDNRRGNLRACTREQNASNTRMCRRNATGYKGVYLHRQSGLWQARLMRNRKQASLGLFRDPVDAALAYDLAVIQSDGEFARPTFLRRG